MPSQVEHVRRRLVEAGKDALERSLSDLHGRAVERAPIGTGVGTGNPPSEDPGRLRASGHVTRVTIGADGKLEGKVVFDTVYAAAQHEGHAIMHRNGTTYEWRARRWSEPDTGPKYLENPLLEMAPRYVRAIAAAVARAARG